MTWTTGHRPEGTAGATCSSQDDADPHAFDGRAIEGITSGADPMSQAEERVRGALGRPRRGD